MLFFWFTKYIPCVGLIFCFISKCSGSDADTHNSNFNTKSNSLPTSSNSWRTLDRETPLIIAHRGEKVLAPEHTLYGYELASILGADYVEPDLCLTKDNVLVCHHDSFLQEDTSDVGDHPEFESLRKQLPSGKYKWEIRDFTLEQIKSLKLRQSPVGIRPYELNGVFKIPTFEEFLSRIHEISFKLNRTIGIIPELKEPSYHNQNQSGSHFMEDLLLSTLKKHGYAVFKNNTQENCQVAALSTKIKCPSVIIQSIELPALEYLKTKTNIDLLMNVFSDAKQLTYKGLERISLSAKYYSIFKAFLQVEAPILFQLHKVPLNMTEIEELGGFIKPKEFSSAAHELGLKLVVYTVYDSREPYLVGCIKPLPCDPDHPMRKTEELNYYFDEGVDGVFVENVAESLQIRTARMMSDLQKFQRSGCGGLFGGAVYSYAMIMLALGLIIALNK